MLTVVRVGPLVTLQARPRRGFARHGVPASGPLDDEAHRAALAAVGGADDDATLEIPLMSATFVASRAVMVSIDGEGPRAFAAGEPIMVPAHARAVRYLAVEGGFAVPEVLGSRATLPNAGLGGFEGRALRKGDVLPLVSPSPFTAGASTVELVVDERIAFASELPFSPIEFVVDPRSDRVGTRLSGATLTGGGEVRSSPLVPGAIQLPPDGQPIVIGPDGPTTGGYRVLGVLDRAMRDRLARLRPGARCVLVGRADQSA
ncbi:MAG: allophanate hydrolase subunit 2 family protein [Myxococcales bacterium]|nr:allophanate hydrolase subunit 2 family protein [Myxococcales bacterium]